MAETIPGRLGAGDAGRPGLAGAVPHRLLVRAGRALGGPARAALRLLGRRPGERPPVTQEAIRGLIREGARTGVVEQAEHEIVSRVLRLGDRRAGMLMTPMSELTWLDVADPPDELARKIRESPHSRFPVCAGGIDTVEGVVHVKDLLLQLLAGRPLSIKGLLQIPLFLYEGTPALKVLDMFKQSGMHVAVVLSEYGSVVGLLTLTDIMEAIVGGLPTGADAAEPKAVRRPDGSWLLDGMLTLEEFEETGTLAVGLPRGNTRTLAGFVITHLGHIPRVGDRLEWGGLLFEVVAMDAFRVDKILATPSQAAT